MYCYPNPSIGDSITTMKAGFMLACISRMRTAIDANIHMTGNWSYTIYFLLCLCSVNYYLCVLRLRRNTHWQNRANLDSLLSLVLEHVRKGGFFVSPLPKIGLMGLFYPQPEQVVPTRFKLISSNLVADCQALTWHRVFIVDDAQRKIGILTSFGFECSSTQ